MAGALDHLVVLDLSRILAGPWASQLPADLGATVIKIEKPGSGDDARHWGPPWHGEGTARQSTCFPGANRNKQPVGDKPASGLLLYHGFRPGRHRAPPFSFPAIPMTGPCLSAGALIVALGQGPITLGWMHSIEKIEWEEDWQRAGQWRNYCPDFPNMPSSP